MGFSREEYWSGLLSPSPEDLPDPGIKPMSPALAGGFFTTEPSVKPTGQELKAIHVCIGTVGLCRQTMIMSKAREEGVKKTAVFNSA